MKQNVISSKLAISYRGDYIVDAFTHNDEYTMQARTHDDEIINLQTYIIHILGTNLGEMVVSSDNKIFEPKYGGVNNG